ncbi:MAG: glycosyltransferase [Verrucomicrobiota bacterium JB022]|nr:glycosyltransferase [Verrucomicrobiota bacterium JB022]
MPKLKIAFFGSSLVSAYWNGAATYYRGMLRAFHARGHEITFYEPDAFERQQHRDLDTPDFARSVVYAANREAMHQCLEHASHADVVVKASGVGIFDEELEAAVLAHQRRGAQVIYWDVDAPATLERLDNNPQDPLRSHIPEYDAVLTYGGGPGVVQAFTQLGSRQCVPIYNALDPEDHHPVPTDERFACDLNFAGNRLPDREERVMEFFFGAARALPEKRFLLAGNGWHQNAPELANVQPMGHLYTRDHNAFNASPRAVLNISRESMARMGYSPATRVFEAAGAGACLITDAWKGVEQFLEPGRECLVAHNGKEVAELLRDLSMKESREIGRRARARLLQEHTYAHRAAELEALLLNRPQFASAS